MRVTPLKVIRLDCIDCCGGSTQRENSPSGCNSPECPSFPLRHGKAVKGIRPLKQIRKKCLKCVCNHPGEVRFCTKPSCHLYP